MTKTSPTPTPSPIESTLADELRLARECADHLPHLADEVEENGWMQWGADIRQAAATITGLIVALSLRTPPQSGEVSQEQVEAVAYLASIDNPVRHVDERGSPYLTYTGQQVIDAFKAGAALNSPPPPSVEVGRQDQGVTPSGSGCQPTASAAVPASSQSGIPDAYDAHPGQLEVVARQIESWLEWSQTHRQSEGLTTKDGTHIMALPVPCWPSHGMFRNWITLFRAVAQRIEARSDETAKQVRPEGREPDGEADAPKDSGHAH
jgi:hypothetical protein